jgi:hypothetical protein
MILPIKLLMLSGAAVPNRTQVKRHDHCLGRSSAALPGCPATGSALISDRMTSFRPVKFVLAASGPTELVIAMNVADLMAAFFEITPPDGTRKPENRPVQPTMASVRKLNHKCRSIKAFVNEFILEFSSHLRATEPGSASRTSDRSEVSTTSRSPSGGLIHPAPPPTSWTWFHEHTYRVDMADAEVAN